MAMLMKVSMRAGQNLNGVAVSSKAAYSAAVAQLRTPAGATSWASWLLYYRNCVLPQGCVLALIVAEWGCRARETGGFRHRHERPSNMCLSHQYACGGPTGRLSTVCH